MKALLPFVVGLPLLLASASTSRLLRFLSFFCLVYPRSAVDIGESRGVAVLV